MTKVVTLVRRHRSSSNLPTSLREAVKKVIFLVAWPLRGGGQAIQYTIYVYTLINIKQIGPVEPCNCDLLTNT